LFVVFGLCSTDVPPPTFTDDNTTTSYTVITFSLSSFP
jgi:hypothetical protein